MPQRPFCNTYTSNKGNSPKPKFIFIEVKLYNKILNLEDQQMEGSCEYKRLVKNFKYNQKVNFKKP
jgi:hypothetical protein